MKVNEYLVKVSAGMVPIDQELALGDSVIVQVNGDVVKLEDQDNQDGTCQRIYTVKGVFSEVIAGGKTVKKDARDSKQTY